MAIIMQFQRTCVLKPVTPLHSEVLERRLIEIILYLASHTGEASHTDCYNYLLNHLFYKM